jgi:hypothetical protein
LLESEKLGYLGSTNYEVTYALRCPRWRGLTGVLGMEVWRPNREGVTESGGVSADAGPLAPRKGCGGCVTLLTTLYEAGWENSVY